MVGAVPLYLCIMGSYVRLPLSINSHGALYGEVRVPMSDHPAKPNVDNVDENGRTVVPVCERGPKNVHETVNETLVTKK